MLTRPERETQRSRTSWASTFSSLMKRRRLSSARGRPPNLRPAADVDSVAPVSGTLPSGRPANPEARRPIQAAQDQLEPRSGMVSPRPRSTRADRIAGRCRPDLPSAPAPSCSRSRHPNGRAPTSKPWPSRSTRATAARSLELPTAARSAAAPITARRPGPCFQPRSATTGDPRQRT